ncbi:hypothetical protein IQ260_15210 [Leptolyngbya cf. ectocarpi LEGE 11479]|uniref:NB-ARC domain-containing protein n=1 Tax=Leptolyngbya cf. ectocarpi LEGE 11479 TaxID=1828722 RepID=A0A928ZV47_LEPEC|nr:NB-ARC domain-containing protein [Leptolyngbya ectocarpi]MBE9067998.1 hypothetical protein [Leptolyngbya cf. ectocarpi LEGE 11479]
MQKKERSTRSLRLSPQKVDYARNAMRRAGFPSQKALAIDVGLTRATVSKFLTGKRVDFMNFVELCEQLALEWRDVAYLEEDEAVEVNVKATGSLQRIDWGDAPEAIAPSSRHSESKQLKDYIQADGCRLVAVTGFLKIGKTQLVAKVSRELADEFDFIMWRSLSPTSTPLDVLTDLLSFLKDDDTIKIEDFNSGVDQLIAFLKEHRCLLILKDLEAVMQSGEGFGAFQPEYEGYEDLLSKIGRKTHCSCLALITREPPKYISIYKDEDSPVRLLQLGGLSLEDARKILGRKRLSGTQASKDKLIRQYGCHPMLIRIAAGYVRELFHDDTDSFLEQGNSFVFNGIRKLLEEAFDRLSSSERTVVYWIAVSQEPVSESALRELVHFSSGKLREILISLCRRALVEIKSQKYSLPHYIREYTLNIIIEGMVGELESDGKDLNFFNTYPLIQSSAKECIKKQQNKNLLIPVFKRLTKRDRNLEHRIKLTLDRLRETFQHRDGYGAANCISLIKQALSEHSDATKPILKDYNFSGLTIKADLRGLLFRNVNFSCTDLSQSVFYEPFGGILALALSADGQYLAAGDASHQVHIWRLHEQHRLEFERTLTGHTHWVRAVAFSPDGTWIASGSEDHSVRIWNRKTGENQALLRGYGSRIRALAFSPDGEYLVSGSDDGTVVVWQVKSAKRLVTKTFEGNAEEMRFRNVVFDRSGELLVVANEAGQVYIWQFQNDPKLTQPRTLKCQREGLRALALHPEGVILATGHDDEFLRLWSVQSKSRTHKLPGHKDWIRCLTFHQSGHCCASSSEDGMIRIWDIRSQKMIELPAEHTSRVWSVDFGEDKDILVSGSDDQQIKLWCLKTHECLATLKGYTSKLRTVTFSPLGDRLASGGDDGIIRIWHSEQGACINQLVGHKGRIWAVAFGQDQRTLVSASDDRTVKYWNLDTGQCIRTFEHHTSWVRSLTLSPDGEWVASGGDDKVVRLANLKTFETREFATGHQDWILKVVYSPDGRYIISSSDIRDNSSVRIWDCQTGDCVKSFEAHSDDVRALDISPDGQWIASGSHDKTIRLLSLEGQEYGQFSPLLGHDDWIRCVTFNPKGSMLASGGYDQRIILWETKSWRPIRTLKGHNGAVISIAFSPNGKTLATCSEDATIRLWNVATGKTIKKLGLDGPYAGLNLTGVRGLSPAQKNRLITLGAIEE